MVVKPGEQFARIRRVRLAPVPRGSLAHAFLLAGGNTVDAGRRQTHGGQFSPGGDARRHDATHKSEIFATYILETFFAMSSPWPNIFLSVRSVNVVILVLLV
jgi:hypothetical protein